MSRTATTSETDLAMEVARWREDPIRFVEGVLGVRSLWSKQVEILQALRDHRRVAVAACHDSGKTFLAACAAWWFVLSHQPAKVITTAPTDRQVRQLLWTEIRSLHSNARVPLAGTVQTTHWQMPGEADWFMTGFATTPDSARANATRFQGYRSPEWHAIRVDALRRRASSGERTPCRSWSHAAGSRRCAGSTARGPRRFGRPRRRPASRTAPPSPDPLSCPGFLLTLLTKLVSDSLPLHIGTQGNDT